MKDLPPIFADVLAKPMGSMQSRGIDRPWVKDGYVWATNGYLLVRMPATSELAETYAVGTRKLVDPSIPISATGGFDAEETSLPDVDAARIDCRRCNGVGWSGYCPQCGHVLGTQGRAECEDCDGTGQVWPAFAVILGRTKLQCKCVSLLRRHGILAVRVGKNRTRNGKRAGDPQANYDVWFAHPVEGWEGLLGAAVGDADVIEDVAAAVPSPSNK